MWTLTSSAGTEQDRMFMFFFLKKQEGSDAYPYWNILNHQHKVQARKIGKIEFSCSQNHIILIQSYHQLILHCVLLANWYSTKRQTWDTPQIGRHGNLPIWVRRPIKPRGLNTGALHCVLLLAAYHQLEALVFCISCLPPNPTHTM